MRRSGFFTQGKLFPCLSQNFSTIFSFEKASKTFFQVHRPTSAGLKAATKDIPSRISTGVQIGDVTVPFEGKKCFINFWDKFFPFVSTWNFHTNTLTHDFSRRKPSAARYGKLLSGSQCLAPLTEFICCFALVAFDSTNSTTFTSNSFTRLPNRQMMRFDIPGWLFLDEALIELAEEPYDVVRAMKALNTSGVVNLPKPTLTFDEVFFAQKSTKKKLPVDARGNRSKPIRNFLKVFCRQLKSTENYASAHCARFLWKDKKSVKLQWTFNSQFLHKLLERLI